MKFKILNNEPLQFYDSNANLTGTIKISGSGGDLYITPESGSSRDVIIGDSTTVGDVEIGGTSSPVNLRLLGGGTLTSNGNILYIGDVTAGDRVVISNATFTSSLQITGSLRVSGSAYAQYFVGDGSGLTNINASASIAILDEGTLLTSSVASIDFVGTGVSASATGGNVTVTINGGGGSTDTGSLLTTASFSDPIITFTKGDGTTFAVNLSSLQPTTASYSVTASYALNAGTTIDTSSFVTTSSFNSFTSSYTTGSFTGSFFGNGSGLLGVISSSYAESASYALSSSYSISSSYATTASYTSNSQNTSDILIYVKNVTGTSIEKGKVVRITGATGDNALISIASYESDGVSANTLGILNETIANDSFGYAITEGSLIGINTNTFTAGQLLFLGPTGSIIGYEPVAPLHAVRLGQALRIQSINGSMYVRIDNGYELDELHNVLIVSGSDGDLLIASGSNDNGKKLYINSRQLTGSYGLTGSLNVLDGGISIKTGSQTLSTTYNVSSNMYRLDSTANLSFLAGASAGLSFYVNNSTANRAMFIHSSSAVLIGNQSVSNPLATLHVTNIGTSNSFLVEDSTNPDTTPFVIDTTGSVGIGTTLPSHKLHIASNDPTLLVVERTLNGNAHIRYQNTTGSMWAGLSPIGNFSISNQIDLSSGFFTVSSAGNVGIGTTTPNARLVVSGSTIITGSLNVTTGITGSLFGTASYSENSKLFDGNNTAVFATTASNTFKSDQIISGSLTITNDLTVIGSSSIQYITSSQLDVSTNIISVNTFSPALRFGGLEVIDSGSSPQTSGSLLFDSQNNQWIFVHQDGGGSAITSSVLIMGPQTFNNVGNETTITTNRITKGTGGDLGEHIGDSNITDTGTMVSINSNTQITGSVLISDSLTVGGIILGNGGMSMSGSNSITGSLIISGSTTALNVVGNTNVTGSLTVTTSITGSGLRITGSSTADLVRITQTGAGNAFVVEDSTNPDTTPFTISATGNTGIGAASDSLTKLTIANTSVNNNSYGIVVTATGPNNGSRTSIGITSTGDSSADNIGIYGYAAAGFLGADTNTGVYGVANGVDNSTLSIGGYFAATRSIDNYSVQLTDGTEAAGKVLVSQTSTGKANWSTKLSGSYEITGSLTVLGSYNTPSGNTIDSDALVQAALLYLSNNF